MSGDVRHGLAEFGSIDWSRFTAEGYRGFWWFDDRCLYLRKGDASLDCEIWELPQPLIYELQRAHQQGASEAQAKIRNALGVT